MWLIGASLSEPHIDHDNDPRIWNNDIYLSIYVSFTPRLSHSGSQVPYMPYNALCISVYWRAHMRGLHLHALDCSTEQLELLVSAVIFIDEDR